MSTATRHHRVREIEYPDSDGKPMSDNTLQFKWIVTIKEGLDAQFDEEPNVFVAGDLLWYPIEGDNKTRIGPDVLVAFGRPKGKRGSYRQWEEDGIAPQVVFEILSPGNRAAELKRKLEFYERFGVEEYYIYNPENGDLIGWRRQGDKLKKIRRMKGFVSRRLGVRFEPGKGEDNLTLIGSDGRPFISPLEMSRRLKEAERQRAAERERAEEAERLRAAERERAEEAERLRAAERERAEEAERASADERQRADRYAAMLREMGIKID
jgi:Uma2 family endonuclease